MTPLSNLSAIIEPPVTIGEVTWPIGLLYDLDLNDIFKIFLNIIIKINKEDMPKLLMFILVEIYEFLTIYIKNKFKFKIKWIC
jgi:uncharacterized membrane protein (DUF373 family)